MSLTESERKGITRREFLGTSVAVAGTLHALSSTQAFGAAGTSSASALETRLGVKFVVNALIHEGAWEGSCRVGNLASLTFQAEGDDQTRRFGEFQEELAARKLPANLEILEPVATHLWVEKGNPNIMLKEDQLKQLDPDDSRTDVYVVAGDGLPQYTCLRIAERFKKPVIILNPAGWATDAPAGIRSVGLEGYYAQNWSAVERQLRLLAVRKAVKHTRVLAVTNFPQEVPRGVISSVRNLDAVREKYGADFRNMDYATFFGEMDTIVQQEAIQQQAEHMAGDLVPNAKANNMKREDVAKSVLFYLAAKSVMDKYDCNAFTIECFELCSSLNPWNRRFTPCLTHALLKDRGYPSACEHDINALLAMMVEMYLSRKAIYMGNPDIDLEKNLLSIHHSVASLKMLGIDAPATPYRIQSFTQSGFGATLRHDFNQDREEVVTLGRFDPTGAKMLVTKGKITGGEGLEGIGCAQGVHIQIADGKALMRELGDFGHHLAMVFGDYVDDIRDLSEVMRFEVANV
jgi:L-fucose isomerase-like protein